PYRTPMMGLAVADLVAESDAHPKPDLPLRWGLDHGRPHRLLNGERACNGVRGTLKLNDETVAHSAHEPPPACLDPRVDHVAPNRGEGGVRSLFIRSHQPRIADNVGAQHDSKSVFDSGCTHLPCISPLKVLP